MEKRQALLIYRDAPPSVTGLRSDVYLASDVDAKFKEYDDDNVALSKSVVKLGDRIADLESALRELLQDTQHVNHNCGDGPDLCPVLRAREVLNELMER